MSASSDPGSDPSSDSSAPRLAGRLTPGSAAITAAVAAVGSIVVTTLVAVIGKAAGAPDDAMQLQPATYIPLVVIGVIAGTIGWFLIARRAANPRRVLSRLVPATLLVLFVPDVLIAASGNATWGTAITLMLMHLAVAAVALPAFAKLLPLPASAPIASNLSSRGVSA